MFLPVVSCLARSRVLAYLAGESIELFGRKASICVY